MVRYVFVTPGPRPSFSDGINSSLESVHVFTASEAAGQVILKGLPVVLVCFPSGIMLWSLGWANIQEGGGIAFSCKRFIDTPPNSPPFLV